MNRNYYFAYAYYFTMKILRLICDAKNSSDPENVSCGTG